MHLSKPCLISTLLIPFFLASCSDSSKVVEYQAKSQADTQANTQTVSHTKSQNKAVNCLHIDLGLPPEEVSRRVEARKQSPDIDLLKRVSLPENASECSKRDFVDYILFFSSNQRTFQASDPQTSMIRVAIAGSEEEYLSEGKEGYSPKRYIYYALKDLLGPDKKQLVIDNLARYPWLIDIVIQQAWSEDARDIVIKHATSENGRVNYNYIRALASLNDPSLSALLSLSFINSRGNRHIAYSHLRTLEWFDSITPMKTLWQTQNISTLESDAFAIPLLESGFQDPFDYLLDRIDKRPSNSKYTSNLEVLNSVTEQNLSQEAMHTWLSTHRKHLSFNPKTKKYSVEK